MNIYLTGSGAFGVMVGEALHAAGHTLTGVASPLARRGHHPGADLGAGAAGWDRLRAWAYPRRIPWTAAPDLRAIHIPDGTEVIVAAHSRAFVGRRTRARARHGAVGYHPSLLPVHRGRDAVRWTVRDGDRVSGGTVYRLTEHVDAGPICAQEHVLVPPGITARELWRTLLAPLGVRLLLQVVDDLAAGRLIEVPQDVACATWEPALDPPRLPRPELPALTAPGVPRVIADREALWR